MIKQTLVAALPVLAAATVLTGCGSASSPNKPLASHSAPVAPPATPPAELQAIHRAVAAECQGAQALDTSVTSATTVGQFASGVTGWEAQLTALGHIPMTGVPTGPNDARQIAVDYAKANLALLLASVHDNPFGPHFSTRDVRRGYGQATASLQDVLNRCAAQGS